MLVFPSSQKIETCFIHPSERFVPALVSKPSIAVAGFLLYLQSHLINNSMDNAKISRLLLATKNRLDILEYSLDVAEIKIKALENNLTDEQKKDYVLKVRHQVKHLLEHHRNPDLQKLLTDLDVHEDF